MNYISLGDHCCPALLLRKLGLRIFAYPFDWVMTDNIEIPITSVLLKILHRLWESNDSMAITNIWFEGFRPCPEYKFRNNLGIAFPHESAEMDIDEIRQKYARRFERLLQHLKTPSKFILCTRFTQLTTDDYKILQTLCGLHPENRILIYSGIQQPVFDDNIDERIVLEVIPYNRNDYYNYDYTVFRPTIEAKFREWFASI